MEFAKKNVEWGTPGKVVDLYDDTYAEAYDRLHLWPGKHATNLKIISGILKQLRTFAPNWLDTCCGQAWHFAQFPDTIKKTGVDISEAQLKRAARRNPDATFYPADILAVDLPQNHFNLVTNLWCAYCYLDDFARIQKLVERAIGWTRRGGFLYFELVTADRVAEYNLWPEEMREGAYVYNRKDNYVHWGYRDSGGDHLMTSPPKEFFFDLISPHFHDLKFISRGALKDLVGVRKK